MSAITCSSEHKGEDPRSSAAKVEAKAAPSAISSGTTNANLVRRNKRSFEDVRIFEYTSAANPDLKLVPVFAHPAELHKSGPSRVIHFDLSEQQGLPNVATSPNLLASFIRICEGESVETTAVATSQAFYVIRGEGKSVTAGSEDLEWEQGDLFVIPSNLGAAGKALVHSATKDAALYWVNDEPLLKYLGVAPVTERFNITHFTNQVMLSEVERISHEPGAEHRNRLGILLGNSTTEDSTKTLTHTLWSLLNVLPAQSQQRPHRHNSVALDLCVSASIPAEGHGEGGRSPVYTLMGPELDEDGWVKDPVRCDWITGAVFTTPQGWWHSHHNESDEPAWVLPMQDAGLLTHQRVLDIRFAPPLKKQSP